MRALILGGLLILGITLASHAPVPTPAPDQTALLASGAAEAVPAQDRGRRGRQWARRSWDGPRVDNASATASGYGFQFVRIKYNSSRGWTWAFDYPTAEQNLYEAIRRTTKLHLEGEPLVLTLDDESIFEFPVLYLCEPGFWITNDAEIETLQKYFARGGFLIIDDFHDYGDGQVGPQWNNFYDIIKRVFPDREPVELPPDHPIWSIYYDIDPVAAISTKIKTGEVSWLDSDDDTYYGIFDDTGRLMVVICYNQDIGDGWEWPNRNVAEASTVSFQMAINFIFYALTH